MRYSIDRSWCCGLAMSSNSITNKLGGLMQIEE